MAGERPWLVLAGGGTGGHLYPGLAVADALRALQPDFQVTVFGTPRPIDQRLTAERRVELVRQEVRPFPKKPWQWPGFFAAWRRSVAAATERFRKRRPVVVLGLGGYPSGPAVVAAAKLGVPAAIFNPDAVPGRANRKLAGRVHRVFVQWQETVDRFSQARDVRVTGCPIRPEFTKATRRNGARALHIDETRPTLLITGASQGARSINATSMEMMDFWRVANEWQIVHLSGEADLKTCRARYKEAGVSARVFAYTEHMALCMAAADLIVSRAGAGTLAEITAMGLPSVLMPYPFDRNRHQDANARILADAHAAAIVADSNAPRDNARRLREALRDLMRSEHRRRRMAQAAAALGTHHAAAAIAEQLLELARE